MKTRIAVVEDNFYLSRVVEEKLSFFDEFQLKFTAKNGKDLLDKLDGNLPLDLILMDLEMPELNGIEATREVKKRYPQIKVIMLTVFDNDENIFHSIQAGADGYLLKEIDAEQLKKGIIDTLKGGAAMTPSIALKALRLLRNPVSFELNSKEEIQLSSREIEVLEQLSKGLSYSKIAENLFLSPSTVRKHIENIYKKLQVHNKLEAVQKAEKNNLI